MPCRPSRRSSINPRPTSVWQTWKYLANGNKGFIGWVEDWFKGKEPKPWIETVGQTWKEAERIAPKLTGAEWIDDGVAIYYSQASIQLAWIFDAEAHGKTWINRNVDGDHGSSQFVRHAWINMLRDEGIQFGWLSYVDLIQHGVPAKYRVLVLPATLCLSDAEARRIKEFCNRGGTVIAGLFARPLGSARQGSSEWRGARRNVRRET